GHRLWLAGGAARDLLLGLPAHEVNDLDLAGTAPTGRFCDLAQQSLRAMGMTEHYVRVIPGSLVISIVTPPTTNRGRAPQQLIEYRGLNQSGFRFPAVGSQLAEDARNRDFTFNTILYDVLDHQVIDTSGSGLGDLCGVKRRFVPMSIAKSSPEIANTLIRAAKFALRWSEESELDLSPLHDWLSTVPTDFADSFHDCEWTCFAEFYRTEVQAPTEAQSEFVAALPSPGNTFLARLIGAV
ncbi:MAG TPA: hypothetical protein VF821_28110, partial [Lentzea sp.]